MTRQPNESCASMRIGMSPEEHANRLAAMHARINGLTSPDMTASTEEILEDLRVALEELRVAEEELRQQNEELASTHVELDLERRRYEQLFEFAPNPYLVTDPLGIIIQSNQSAATLLYVPPRFLPGKALATYIANEDRPRFRSLITAIPCDGRSRTVAFKLQPRDGDVVEAELTYSATAGTDGGRDQIRWMARDVTEHERMARQIRALNAQLESRVAAQTADLSAAQRLAPEALEKRQEARRAAEASEAQSRHVQKLESIGVLAGGIAHDFNNLLHVVLGNADIALSNLNTGSAAREPLEEVVRATLRAADLTRQLLAYSEKGAFVVRHLDLSTEVREMATLLRTSISKQATLAWELASDLPAISADPTQIRQVVMNLITNASDALGDSGGTITLRTGIADLEEVEQQRFGRPPHGDDPAEPVAGPLVYVEIGDSGQGMSPDTLSRIFDPFFSTKFSGRGTGTILVVEDEEGVREVAERMLQDIGFETIGAEDGRHALDLMEEVGDRVTAVLLDLSMPRMGGAETFRRLREMKPDLPILMMSGYTEQVVAPQFSNSGPGTTGFLQKPFLAEDLIAILRRFAESATG